MPNLKKECPYCAKEGLVCIDSRPNHMQLRVIAEMSRIYYCEACEQTMLVRTPMSTISKVNYPYIPKKYKKTKLS